MGFDYHAIGFDYHAIGFDYLASGLDYIYVIELLQQIDRSKEAIEYDRSAMRN